MCRSRRDGGHGFAYLLIAFLSGLPLVPVAAQDASLDAPASNGSVYMFSVRVNGWALGLTARFHEEDGRLWMPPEQFDGIGFRLDESLVTVVDGQRRLYLDTLDGVTWEIDRQAQTIDIQAPFDLLRPNMLRLSPAVARVESRSNWGALFAYDLYGEYSSRSRSEIYARTLSIDLEARLFSPIFMATTRGYSSISEGEDEPEFVRLESYVDFDDVDDVWRLRLGDSITVGPVWLRTLRFGGVQWGREFGLRPDIVTTPMPVLNQDISVPSTIDVYINEVRRYSQAVDPGAFRVTDLPVSEGSNRVRMVITDQSGRRIEVVVPLYSSIELLSDGLFTFNVEAGAERQRYAVVSNDYGRPFASAAVGYGISDRLTVRGYGAAAEDYWMGAAGATFAIGRLLLVEATAMHSDGPRGSGWSWYGSVEHVSENFNLFGSYMHSTDGFRDLAGNFGYNIFTDQAIASGGINLGRFGHFNASWVMQRELSGEESSLVTGNYGIGLFRDQLNFSVNGYKELTTGDWGAYVSLSFPLGPRTYAYAEHSWRNGILSSAASIRGEDEDGQFDWEIAGEQGEFDEVTAQAGWDGEQVDARLQVAGSHGEYGVRAELAQSLVFMDGRLNIAGRIDDAFAIVEVENMPGVRVALENRVIGRTGRSGRLFVTGLNSYVANSISIDPLDLPINASIRDTSISIAPRAGGGTIARFGVSQENSAILVLEMPDGMPPPVGAVATLEGSEIPAVVGYEGETYVRGLRDGQNRVTVNWRNGQCSAEFSVPAQSDALPRLGPFVCMP